MVSFALSVWKVLLGLECLTAKGKAYWLDYISLAESAAIYWALAKGKEVDYKL